MIGINTLAAQLHVESSTVPMTAGEGRLHEPPPAAASPAGKTPSPQTVPREVGAQRRPHRDDNDPAQTQPRAPCQRAGADQGGDHRYREAALIAENPRKQKPLEVVENHTRPLPVRASAV